MAATLMIPNLNIQGAIELVKQTHGFHIATEQTGCLQDIKNLAKLFTGEDNLDIKEALKMPGFLKHFSYTFAVACNVTGVAEFINEVPLTISIIDGPRGMVIIVVTGTLDQWVKLPHSYWVDEIIKRFEFLGLGGMF